MGLRIYLLGLGLLAFIGCSGSDSAFRRATGDSGAGGGSGSGGASAGGADSGTGTGGGSTSCTTGQTQSCYTGRTGTVGVGVCHAGIQYCIGSTFGPCVGEVTPSTESCNGADDDCSGTPDDGLGTITCGTGACQQTVSACSSGKPNACVPLAGSAENCGNSIDDDCDGVPDNGCGCVYVAPSGSDGAGTGSASAPFLTISHAIQQAGTNNLPMEVCVASTSPTCAAGSSSTATYTEAITMRDGVSVYGGYQYNPTGSVWTRTVGTLQLQNDGSVVRSGCVTAITSTTDSGVVFPASVTSPTSLDGFTVNATVNATGTTAAITVQGSTGAIINDDIVNGGGVGSASVGLVTYGIHVDGTSGSATPRITNNAILGGTGKTSIGVRSYRSAPVIEDQCGIASGSPYDSAGRCSEWACGSACWNAVIRRFIRGRPANSNTCGAATATADTETNAVRLEDSAGAVVARNAMCTSNSQGDAAGVRITGDASGVIVRANEIEGMGPSTGNVNAVGVWADACAGASPWIYDNYRISGGSRTVGARGDGIRAIGDCHPRIDSNQVIIGGEESSNNDAYGVYCATDTQGTASRCTILNNLDILGSSAGFPPISAGVRCDKGGCARIENNTRISARQGIDTYGIILDSTDTVVARNGIDAGCGRGDSAGIYSLDSWARIENNVIGGSRYTTTGGGSCDPGAAFATTSHAVKAVLGSGSNELELNGNDLFALGTPNVCTSTALAFGVDTTRFAAPTAPLGVVRNNVLHTGACNTTYGIQELDPAADPRVVENNDTWFGACGAITGIPCSTTASSVLYRDEGATDIAAIGGVNALTDITVGQNLSVDPAFVGLAFAGTPVTAIGAPPSIDVRIPNTSPLGDVGTSAGQPPGVDFYGSTRPVGAGYDIGAHEHP